MEFSLLNGRLLSFAPIKLFLCWLLSEICAPPSRVAVLQIVFLIFIVVKVMFIFVSQESRRFKDGFEMFIFVAFFVFR